MQEIARDRGSFRDPSGYVFQWHKRIFRVVEACARESYEWVRDSGALCRLQNEGDLVATREVPPESWPGNFGRAAYVASTHTVCVLSLRMELQRAKGRRAAPFGSATQAPAERHHAVRR